MTKATVATLALDVATLQATVAQLVAENTALTQRSSNFAARMTCSRKIMIAEITRLRDIVENGPARVTAGSERVPRPEFNAALAALKAETGVGFHPAEVVRQKALTLRQAVAEMIRVPGDAPFEDDLPF